MGVSTRLGEIIILQDKTASAAPGAMLDVTDAVSAVLEISGNATGLTANFEASIDAGATWYPVSLSDMSATPTLTRVSAATARGLYFLEFARPLNAIRARISAATPAGNMTIRGRAALT